MKHRTGFLLLVLFLIPSMWTFALDNTQVGNCQLDLSSAVGALKTAQQAIDKGDTDSALHTVGEARNALQLLEAKCADYAPKNAGNSRTNPILFGQRQHVEMRDDFDGSIQLTNFVDNANDYVLQADKDNEPAPDGSRYILLRFKYSCEKPASESCEFRSFYFAIVGDRGVVYNHFVGGEYDIAISGIKDREEIFGGTEIDVEVPFVVHADDNNFVMITDHGKRPVYFASK